MWRPSFDPSGTPDRRLRNLMGAQAAADKKDEDVLRSPKDLRDASKSLEPRAGSIEMRSSNERWIGGVKLSFRSPLARSWYVTDPAL